MKKLTNRLIGLLQLMSFLAFVSASIVVSMDVPAQYIASVWVETNDGLVLPVEGWQIPEMKTLLVLFEHQRATNSRDNPLKASMISYDELSILVDAFKASRELVFDQFFADLAYRDGLWDAAQGKWPQFVYTLGEGRLRMLVNAAAKVEAQGISALCGTYYLPEEMQRPIVAQMIDPITDFLREQIISHADEEAVFFNFADKPNKMSSVVFSPDSTKMYVGFLNGVLEVWEVLASGKNLLRTFNNLELNCVYEVALNADGTICAALGVNNLTQEIEVLVLTEFGELVRRHATGIFEDVFIGKGSLAFNPMNNNQIVFGYRGSFFGNNIVASQFLDISTGIVTPLLGYNGATKELSFSSDGSMVLGLGRDIFIWDTTSCNLIVRIDTNKFRESCNVMFCGNSKKIMISGVVQDQRWLEIGEIDDGNNYVIESTFICDHLFKEEKESTLVDFYAKLSFDGTKVALYSESFKYGHDCELALCNNDFSKVLYNHSFYRIYDKIGFAWSKNSKLLALCKWAFPSTITILPMISSKEELLLHDLFDLNLAQMRLLYQLYCMRLRGARVGFDDVQDNAIFMSIPFEVRLFLSKYLFNKLAKTKCIGNECTIL